MSIVRRSRNDYADQPSRERLEAAEIDLDYGSHPGLWFEDFMYYYKPFFEIVTVEQEIAEVVSRAQGGDCRVNSPANQVNELVSIYHKQIQNCGDYTTRETFHRCLEGRFFSVEEGDDIMMIPKLGVYTDILSFLKVHNTSGWLEFRNVIEQAIGRFGYTDVDNRLHNTSKIGYAAHLNYMIEAGRRLPSMLLASTLYAAAIALILIITVDQTLAVLSAAGWR